jgi:hypothetical protein
LLARDELRRLEIQGELSGLVVYTSTNTGEMGIEELQL